MDGFAGFVLCGVRVVWASDVMGIMSWFVNDCLWIMFGLLSIWWGGCCLFWGWMIRLCHLVWIFAVGILLYCLVIVFDLPCVFLRRFVI